jgi:hypothetical protein
MSAGVGYREWFGGWSSSLISKIWRIVMNRLWLVQFKVCIITTAWRQHRVETYRDVTSVPTFFVRMLGKLLDACIWLEWRLTLNLLSTRSWSFFAWSPGKKWVHDNVIFSSVYNGQLRLCMSYLLCDDSEIANISWFDDW